MSVCEMCPNRAYFSCGNCLNTAYCCKDHQIQHWKKGHYKKCHKPKEGTYVNLEELLKKRYFYRKQFYENYGAESYEMCILDCKVMLNVDR